MRAAIILVFSLIGASCSDPSAVWPPAPRNKQERFIMEAALRAVNQIDGWPQTACVIERHKAEWRVQAWRIVNPKAKGRARCVPWAVRGITLSDEGKVVAYQNHL